MGIQIPRCDGAVLRGEKGRPVVKYRDTVVSCPKTAEPIVMLFGTWPQMCPRKHILDWGAHWCNLANTSELSVCDGDAAFRSNYFDYLLLKRNWAEVSAYNKHVYLTIHFYMWISICNIVYMSTLFCVLVDSIMIFVAC